MDFGERSINPEHRLAGELLKVVKHKLDGSGHVTWIDPVALRELIVTRWDRISTLAHAIHDAKPKEKTTREKVEDWHTVDQLRAALAAVHEKLEKLENHLRWQGYTG